MYPVDLAQSFFPAQRNTPIEEITIGDLVRRQARRRGDACALKELASDGAIGRTWTFSELCADAERMARALASRHAPGARIAVYANNSPEWLLLEVAAAMAGLTLVTVNPAYQRRELKYVLEQSRSEGVYFVQAFRGNPMGEIVNAVSDEIPAVRWRIDLNDEDALYRGEDEGVLPDVSPRDVTQIQYTSGTTGFPKGALLHHFGLVQNAHDIMDRAGVKAGDSYVHYMPMFHTTGCAILALGGLAIGATQLLAPMFDPAVIVRVIERERPVYMLGVPTMIVALVEEARRTGADLSSIRGIVSGGAMVPPELCRKAKETFGCYIQIIYGQTEASPGITLAWSGDTLENLTETIGQPLPHMDVAVLDPHTNEVLPIGAQGEICCRGYNIMTGYNDNREATAKAIDPDGWLHTGDLGAMDARGYVRITGRVKEMIIRGGENLFPAEIENALLEHPEIVEIAVVGVPDEKWGEQVACFMRSRADDRPSAAELKTFVRERLSPQKTPVYWIWVDDWPLTGSGKIQKFKLAEQFAAGAFKADSA